MKFPSIKYLTTQAGNTAKRFYLPLLFAGIGTCFAWLMVNNYNSPLFHSYTRILLTCLLALPLSLGSMLYTERSQKPYMKWAMPILAICFSLIYWAWLAPDALFDHYRQTLIFFVLAIVMHLWVAIAAYLGHNERTGFWRFNETLYARMILAAVFSGALYLGLSLAITACKILFKLDIDGDIYIRLWIIIAGIFNTWFFLAGIPADYTEVNAVATFPKALKIFTQYILIPIVTLYMVILYAYGFKIIGMWSLPKGWVSMLIFCYSVVGILAVLLVNPLRDDAGNPWVRLFSRFFFRASLPLVALLYAAIFARVGQYGITESRYYLVLLGAWLGYISLYFIFSAGKNIRVIPLSLAIIGVLSLFGPWSVFSVSERSQLHRLEAILIKNNIWHSGEKVTRSNKPIKNNADAEQLRNIIEYFINRNNTEALQPVYAISIKSLVKYTYRGVNGGHTSDWEAENTLKDSLTHILCTNSINGMTTYRNDLHFAINMQRGLNVAGYSKMFNVSFDYYNQNKKEWIFLTPTDSIKVTLTQHSNSTTIDFLHGKITDTISLNPLITYLRTHDQEDIAQQQMTIDGTNSMEPRIIIRSINIKHPQSVENDDKIVRELDMSVLLK